MVDRLVDFERVVGRELFDGSVDLLIVENFCRDLIAHDVLDSGLGGLRRLAPYKAFFGLRCARG
jgi:hypothetical protein